MTAVSAMALLAAQPAITATGVTELVNVEMDDLRADGVNALNVSQTTGGSQTILNMASYGRGGVDQSGVNTLNMVDAGDATLNVTEQVADADQTVRNIQTADTGPLLNARQEAANFANVINAANVGRADQVFVDGSSQIAENVVNYSGSADGLEQTASNALNVVEVDGVAEVVDQGFPNTATQTARNVLNASDLGGDVSNVAQSGSNVANHVTGTDVGRISRTALGDQLVENRIEFRDDLRDVSQTGVNIANLARVESFEVIEQSAEGEQKIVNSITSLTPGRDGNVDTLTQYGVNIANVTYLTDGAGGQGTLVEQSSGLSQSVINELNTKGDQVNVIQRSDNIANEVRIER